MLNVSTNLKLTNSLIHELVDCLNGGLKDEDRLLDS